MVVGGHTGTAIMADLTDTNPGLLRIRRKKKLQEPITELANTLVPGR